MKKLVFILFLFSFLANAQTDEHSAEYSEKLTKLRNKVSDTLSADYYYQRAGIHHDYSFFSKAVNDYDKALKLVTDNNEWWYARGVSKIELEKYKEAIADFDKAESLRKQHYIYNMRGICYYKLKKYSKAIQDYSKAIELKSDFAEAYNNRGVAKIKNGAQAEGCAEVRKALELGDSKSQFVLDKYCK